MKTGHALIITALLSMLVACASGIDGARQALASAERLQVVAVKTFEQFDEQQQAGIIADARQTGEIEAARVRMVAYRAKRDTVKLVLVDSAAVISVGHAVIPAVERGIKKDTDLRAWLADLIAVGVRVRAAIQQFAGSTK